jgi:hypothetical protein
MKYSTGVAALAVVCAFGVFAGGNLATPVFGQTTAEPLSKTYRVTRADDVEFQKIEPFKVFDNLYYVGPGYVSLWLLTTPDGNILFETAQEPGHTPGIVTTEGITVYDGGRPYRAMVWGRANAAKAVEEEKQQAKK